MNKDEIIDYFEQDGWCLNEKDTDTLSFSPYNTEGWQRVIGDTVLECPKDIKILVNDYK
jgi:hypothetical protein